MLRLVLPAIVWLAWLGGLFAASQEYHTKQERAQAATEAPLTAEPWNATDIILPDPALAYDTISKSKLWPGAKVAAIPQAANADKPAGKAAKSEPKPKQKPPPKPPPKPLKPVALKAITQVGSASWAIFMIDNKRKRLRAGDMLQEGQQVLRIGSTWVDIKDASGTTRTKLFASQKKD